MVEDYQKSFELIFAYGYECCMVKHNIRCDQLEVPNGMHDSSNPLPPEFFVNCRCLLVPLATKAIATEADQSEVARRAEDLERSVPFFFF